MGKVSEFQKRCKMLKQLGIDFHREYEYRGEGKDRKSHDVDVFKSVKIPFSAHELVGILMNEGQFYIGGCCGNSSAIQDKVESVLRFNQGWIDIRDLEEIAEARIHHDGDDSEFVKLKRPLEKEVAWCVGQLKKVKKARETGKQVLDPWYQMALAWHLTKDHYNPERPHLPASVTNKKHSELDNAVSTLEHGLRYLSIEKVFGSKEKGDKPQTDANRLVLLARLFPALKTLNKHVKELAPPPLKGVALVRKDEPEVVLENGRGLCIYKSDSDAQKLIDLWTQEEQQFVGEGKNYPKLKPAASEFLIRKVTVTTERGVKFL